MEQGREPALLDIPAKTEELFTRIPSFSASHGWERTVLAEIRARFLAAYYLAAYCAARDRFVAGQRDVAFPEGTWLMRQRFKVRCEPLAAT